MCGTLNEDLIAELDVAIDARNHLAHRYLREQHALPPPIFGNRMFHEMQELQKAFDALTAKLGAETDRLFREKVDPDEDVSYPGIEDLAKRLMFGTEA